jgi:hypothetical protein
MVARWKIPGIPSPFSRAYVSMTAVSSHHTRIILQYPPVVSCSCCSYCSSLLVPPKTQLVGTRVGTRAACDRDPSLHRPLTRMLSHFCFHSLKSPSLLSATILLGPSLNLSSLRVSPISFHVCCFNNKVTSYLLPGNEIACLRKDSTLIKFSAVSCYFLLLYETRRT